jgi:hypothetical protein
MTSLVVQPLPYPGSHNVDACAAWWRSTLALVVNHAQSNIKLVVNQVAFDVDLDRVVWSDVVKSVALHLETDCDVPDAPPPPATMLRFKCNWASDTFITTLFTKLFTPEFLTDPLLHGWTVVVNAIRDSDPELPDPARTIVLRMEPNTDDPNDPFWDRWLDRYPSQVVVTKSSFAHWGSHAWHLNPIEWHLPFTYAELQQLSSPGKETHRDVVSVVCSAFDFMPGHKWRLGFLKHWFTRLTKRSPGVPRMHLWGKSGHLGMPSVYRGELPEHDKSAALLDYRYTFAAENVVKANYATEKVWDALLSDTVCFYYGPDLSAWVERGALVPLSNEYTEALDQMMTVVGAPNQYTSFHLPAIQRTKTALLTRWSLQCRVRDTVLWHTINPMVLVINMASRPERMEKFHKRAARVGLCEPQYTRWPAVEGLGQANWTRHVDLENVVRPLRTGEVGCIASHMAVWEEVVRTQRPALVFEDDCLFGQPLSWDIQTHTGGQAQQTDLCWWDQLTSMFSRLPDYWDWASIGWYSKPHCTSRRYETRRNAGRWIKLQELFRDPMPSEAHNDGFGSFGGGAFSYLVSPTGAQRLLSQRAIWPLDYHMMHLVREGVCPQTYAWSAPITYAQIATAGNTVGSDIQRTEYVLLPHQTDKFNAYIQGKEAKAKVPVQG